jgi:quinolinate synthase
VSKDHAEVIERQMLTNSQREEISRLKRERDVIILAHYYVEDDAQDVADFIGDSFYLAQKAQDIRCSILVFAGVEFMAQSAKLLSPEKRVLMPDTTAGCPMAHMVLKSTVDNARARYGDDLAIVCYVNSTIQTKSWSDVCVTSSNAVKIVSQLPQHHILFIPDMNLGHYISQQLPSKRIILNDGFCVSHEAIELQEIEALKAAHPEAYICVHPECAAWIVDAADYVGSTSGIIRRVVSGKETDYIIGTVFGVHHEIEKQLAASGQLNKHIYFPKTVPICRNMSKVTGEKVLACLRDETGEVAVDPRYAVGARAALERMLELARA